MTKERQELIVKLERSPSVWLNRTSYRLILTHEEITTILAALRAQPEAGVPEGWKLVPIEPTEEMKRAATTCVAGWLDIKGTQLTVNLEKARVRYQAMLAAAPSPPVK